MHVKTSTTYPKGSPSPSKGSFTKQSGRLPSNPSKTDYSGGSKTPHGGHHDSTDRVVRTSMQGGKGSPSASTYPKRSHAPFKGEGKP